LIQSGPCMTSDEYAERIPIKRRMALQEHR
jgi:hypothetical protein